jgi:hypothetical protein
MKALSKNMSNNNIRSTVNTRIERTRRGLFEEFQAATEIARVARVFYIKPILDATGAGRKATTQAASFKKINELEPELIEDAIKNIHAYLGILERTAALKNTIVKTWTEHLTASEKSDIKSLTQLNITNTTTALPFAAPMKTIEAEIIEIQHVLTEAQQSKKKKQKQ